MENLIGKFGSTQWEPPIDEEDAKWYNGGNGIQGHQGLVGKVISIPYPTTVKSTIN